MSIENQLQEPAPFDRIGALQELFDLTTAVQLNAGDLLVKFGNRDRNTTATTEDLVSVLEVALAGAQASRQAILEIYFGLTGEPPQGA